VVGTLNVLQAKGEMVALDVATGKQLWDTRLQQMPLGGATVAGDLVFTTTLTGELLAMSRMNGSIAWTAQLPLIAGAGIPLSAAQQPAVVAYRLSA
jgi:outer membrane protein assembly factor BamB